MLELYGYRRSGDMIIFDMRLDGATITTTKQKQFMVDWMRNGTCKDKDRRALMNLGFRLGYLVYDPNNHKLLEDVITLQQCSQ